LINFVDATNDANHYTKPPPERRVVFTEVRDTASDGSIINLLLLLLLLLLRSVY